MLWIAQEKIGLHYILDAFEVLQLQILYKVQQMRNLVIVGQVAIRHLPILYAV
jgi:hypothetical protein